MKVSRAWKEAGPKLPPIVEQSLVAEHECGASRGGPVVDFDHETCLGVLDEARAGAGRIGQEGPQLVSVVPRPGCVDLEHRCRILDRASDIDAEAAARVLDDVVRRSTWIWLDLPGLVGGKGR